MLRKVLVSAVALSLAAGTAAWAQEAESEDSAGPERTERGDRGPHRMFNRLDSDGDGSIAADEFGGNRLEMMRAADEDSDGTLTQEEIATYLMNREFQRKAERAARRLDIDGDGTVTLAEIEDHQNKRFALLDRNNDGQISQEEMRRSGFAMRMRHMHGMDRHGHRSARHGWGDGDFSRHHRGHPRYIDEMEAGPSEEMPGDE